MAIRTPALCLIAALMPAFISGCSSKDPDVASKCPPGSRTEQPLVSHPPRLPAMVEPLRPFSREAQEPIKLQPGDRVRVGFRVRYLLPADFEVATINIDAPHGDQRPVHVRSKVFHEAKSPTPDLRPAQFPRPELSFTFDGRNENGKPLPPAIYSVQSILNVRATCTPPGEAMHSTGGDIGYIEVTS